MRRIKPYPVPAGTKDEQLAYLAAVVAGCQNCPNLAASRTQTVFGEGNPDAKLMLIGEAPGADEDARGRPFVGRAGKLLTFLIRQMNLHREDVYICNSLKCRPDPPLGESNRPPSSVEMRECLPYLYAQIEIVRPAVILALGNTAMEGLLRDDETHTRGFVYDFNGIHLVTTYHPSYVLRNPTWQVRSNLWAHFLTALELIGVPITDELIDRVPTASDCE